MRGIVARDGRPALPEADPCTIERRSPKRLSRGVGAVLPWVPIAVNKVRPAGRHEDTAQH